jgi:hypothetical protein
MTSLDETQVVDAVIFFTLIGGRDVPVGKGGRRVRLTTYHHIVPMSRNLGALTLLDLSGPAWPVMGVLYLYVIGGSGYEHLQKQVPVKKVLVPGISEKVLSG